MPYKDPERRREYGREWMKRNPERARAAMQRWRQGHKDQHNAEVRAYSARHSERIALRHRDYLRRRPEVAVTREANRRARKAAAVGSHTTAEWVRLCAAYDGRCAYCGGPGPLHRDHRIPLARGGSNDISNIAPACASCNHRKHTLTDREWMIRLLNERLASSEFVVVDWWRRDQIQSAS